jgi:hypothetical protein
MARVQAATNAQAQPAQAPDPFSALTLRRLREHPKFREAAEAAARRALAHFEAAEAPERWLTRDLGRSAIYGAAVLLDGFAGGASVAALTAATARRHIASRGRVIAWVQYARAAGRLTIPAGPEQWTRRRLTLSPTFFASARERLLDTLEQAALVDSDGEAIRASVAQLRGSDEAVRRSLAAMAFHLASRPEVFGNSTSPMHLFLGRDHGLRVLQHLLVGQPAHRPRLLDRARLSRADLARRYDVSRAHLNTLLGDAQVQGLLRLEGRGTVVFHPRLSDDYEDYVALIMRLSTECAKAAAL